MVKNAASKKQTTKSTARTIKKSKSPHYEFKLWHKLTVGAFVFTLAASLFALTPLTHSSSTTVTPAPTQATATSYGSIGKWMLKSNGQIANWGGRKHDNKTLLEVVNVVIVDPTSTSASASTTKINNAMAQAGFPSRSGHSSGFKGIINGVTYAQQPTGRNAYSNNDSSVVNDHGRLFGPAPAASGGYVWSGAFSTEKPIRFLLFTIGHSYLSFTTARDALAQGFVASGQTQEANVDLVNAYNTTSTTTGDHDGEAIVIVLK